jgi:hypothetical protein
MDLELFSQACQCFLRTSSLFLGLVTGASEGTAPSLPATQEDSLQHWTGLPAAG